VYPSGINSRLDGKRGIIPVKGFPSLERRKHKYAGSVPPIFKFTGDGDDDEGSDFGERTKLNPGGTNSFRSGKMIAIAVTQGRCAARSQFLSFFTHKNKVNFLSLKKKGSPLGLCETW